MLAGTRLHVKDKVLLRSEWDAIWIPLDSRRAPALLTSAWQPTPSAAGAISHGCCQAAAECELSKPDPNNMTAHVH
jgi:hypothetical protein